MSKYKIIQLFNKLFISFSVFIIIYAWINFYLRDLWATFTISLITTFALLFILKFYTNKKTIAANNSKKLQDEIELNFYAFKLSPLNEKMDLLKKTLSLDFNVTQNLNSLFYTKDGKKNMLITQTDFDIIDSNILINIISNLDIKNIDILNIVCSEHTANINKKILKNLEINFITKKMLYLDFFNKHNIYPNKENIVLNKPTFCLKNFLYSLFLPNKAKGYFFCGSILLFSSIILPYHYYYIIVGSILVLFGIICKILPNVKN